jgi:hypothetical protein
VLLEEGLDAAHRLACPVLVLDQGQAHVAIAVLAEADPGRDRDLGLGQQQLGELQRARLGEGRRQRCPGEHRGRRAGHLPAGRRQAADQHVAARAVAFAHLLDAVLRAVERRRGGHLDRCEGAVVDIGLHPGQRRDQLGVAAAEADAPAGHGVGLGKRGELDRDLARARHLQDRRRRRAVEVDLGVGDVGDYVDAVAPAEVDDGAVEIQVDDLGGRVGGIVHHQGERLGHRMAHRALELFHEVEARPPGHGADRRAGDDEAEGVDRIARVRHQDDVAGAGDRLAEVGQALLGAQGDDGFALGIELDPEAPRVVAGDRLAQAGNAARGRVAMDPGVLNRLDQLVDHVPGRRLVRVAHAEVDDVVAGRPPRGLELVDLGEDVGRQAFDLVKFLFHGLLVLGEPPCRPAPRPRPAAAFL